MGQKRSCCGLCQRVFFPMFSSKSFIVSGLTFKSLILLEFIFVYDVKECSNFILLHVAVQFSQHHLLKRLSFLHCMFLLLCREVTILTISGLVFSGYLHNTFFFSKGSYAVSSQL